MLFLTAPYSLPELTGKPLQSPLVRHRLAPAGFQVCGHPEWGGLVRKTWGKPEENPPAAWDGPSPGKGRAARRLPGEGRDARTAGVSGALPRSASFWAPAGSEGRRRRGAGLGGSPGGSAAAILLAPGCPGARKWRPARREGTGRGLPGSSPAGAERRGLSAAEPGRWTRTTTRRRKKRRRGGPSRARPGDVGVLWGGAGAEALGAEQLAAERADPEPVAHPPPQALGAHRQRVGAGAAKRWGLARPPPPPPGLFPPSGAG